MGERLCPSLYLPGVAVEGNISWLPPLVVAAVVELHDERQRRRQWGSPDQTNPPGFRTAGKIREAIDATWDEEEQFRTTGAD
jgi:hypothetical protein